MRRGQTWLYPFDGFDWLGHFDDISDDDIVHDVRQACLDLKKHSVNPNGNTFVDLCARNVEGIKKERSEKIRAGLEKKKEQPQQREMAPKDVTIPGNHLAHAGGMASSAAVPAIPTVDEMYAYARSKGLDDILAREWFDMTTERGWADRDGCPVHAWKKMLVGYVRQRAAYLASKNETA